MLGVLLLLLVPNHGEAARRTLAERLGCPYLFERLAPQNNVDNFFVPASVPHHGRLTTPTWIESVEFRRAFLMTTEISPPTHLTQVPEDILKEFTADHDRGRYQPRLRIEQRGLVTWSHAYLHADRTVDVAISPTAILHDLLGRIPNSLWLVTKLGLYFFAPTGTPPSLPMLAEARGALLKAQHDLAKTGGLNPEVKLEVHAIGPLPEDARLFVDFGIDVRGRPVDENPRRERAGSESGSD